jgi:hypothetical protein
MTDLTTRELLDTILRGLEEIGRRFSDGDGASAPTPTGSSPTPQPEHRLKGK